MVAVVRKRRRRPMIGTSNAAGAVQIRHKDYPAAVVTNLVMAKAVREGLHSGTENFFDFAQVVAWLAHE
jgi:hypothetical protein